MCLFFIFKLYFCISFRKSDTFWTTTGLYPQTFVLALSEAADVKTITIHSYNSKWWKLYNTIPFFKVFKFIKTETFD